MNKTQTRASAKIWRHDGYTLRKLHCAIKVIADKIKKKDIHQILDFGAGDSPYKHLFERLEATYIQADLGEDHDLSITPLQPLPCSDGTFDLIVSFQVLEHVWDLDWYLGEAMRLLSPSGKLILSTHGTWLYHPHPSDYRRWTRDGLIKELETRGFEIEETTSLIGPLAWTTQFRALAYHSILSKIPILGALLYPILGTFFYSRMLTEDFITPQELIDTNAAVYLIVARKER